MDRIRTDDEVPPEVSAIKIKGWPKPKCKCDGAVAISAKCSACGRDIPIVEEDRKAGVRAGDVPKVQGYPLYEVPPKPCWKGRVISSHEVEWKSEDVDVSVIITALKAELSREDLDNILRMFNPRGGK